MSRDPEFRDYLLALRKKRLALLLWVAVCAAVVFAYSQLRPVAYRATATVVMLPPKLETELSPAGLTIKTYEALLMSDGVLADVAEKAGISGLTAEGLRESLEVEFVMEQKDRVQEPAPLLLLSATAESPAAAEKIANLWAEAIIEKSTGLRTAQTTEAVETIEELVAKAREELENIDARLTEFNAANNIPFLESKLEVIGEKLKGHQAEYLDAAARLEALNASAGRRKELLAFIESGNRWIGAIRPEELTGAAAGEAKPAGDFFSDNAAGARRNLLETERELIRYRGEFDVELVAQQKEILKGTLKDRQLELKKVQHDTSAQKPLLEQMRAQLEQQPQFLELSRAIEDEALWMRLSGRITAADAKTLAEMKLKTQILNPVYLDAKKELIRMEAEYGALGEKEEYLEAEVEGLSEQVRALSESLDKKSKGIEYLASFRQIELKNYDALSERYNAIRNNLADDMQQASLVGARVAQLDARIRKMTEEFNTLLEEVNTLRFERSRLNTEKETIADSFKMLSQKSEEARIARAYETTDVRLASRAVAPENALPRERLKRSAIAAALALAIGLAFIVASEFIRLTLAEGEKISSE
ncbi:MAG: hypothetical protein ABIH66_06880 [bacterium]